MSENAAKGLDPSDWLRRATTPTLKGDPRERKLEEVVGRRFGEGKSLEDGKQEE